MLEAWLRAPAVARWWPDAESQIASIAEHLGDARMTALIALSAGLPAGYVQHYAAHAWPAPHYAALPQGSVALDLFGAPDAPCRGSLWLDALATSLLRTAPAVAVDPDPANGRARAAMARAGFTDQGPAIDAEGRAVRLMTRLR